MPPDKSRRKYHHGDLRRALVDAGEAELAENGLAGFSLRRVSARVGVSHTAPAHHFGDAAGLIAALAERGFQRLLDCMKARQQTAPPSPYEQLMATGLGYLDFARDYPALFRLIYSLPRGGEPDPAVAAAGEAAFMHLATSVAALHGTAPLAHPGAYAQVMACWTRVHGFAELLLAGYIDPCDEMSGDTHEAMFREVFEATFPMQ